MGHAPAVDWRRSAQILVRTTASVAIALCALGARANAIDFGESNDTHDVATPIRCGDWISATLSPVDDVDYYSFPVERETQAVAQVFRGPGTGPDFYVALGSMNEPPTGDRYVSEIERVCSDWPLPAGRGLLRVWNGTGPYALHLTCLECPTAAATYTPTPSRTPEGTPTPTMTPPPADAYEPDEILLLAKPIACGERQRHSIHHVRDVDWMKVALPQQMQLMVTATADQEPLGWPRLELYDGGLRFLESDYNQVVAPCGREPVGPGQSFFSIQASRSSSPLYVYEVAVECLPCGDADATPTPIPTPAPVTPGVPDAFEPDDRLSLAHPIECNTSQAHNLVGQRDDLDYLSFSLEQLTQVSVVGDAGPVSVNAEVLNDRNLPLPHRYDPDYLCDVDALEAGNYAIRISEALDPNAPGRNYSVALYCRPCERPNPTATPTETPLPTPTYPGGIVPSVDDFEPDDSITAARPIECNSKQAHTIVPIRDRDWFSMTVTAVTQVLLRVHTLTDSATTIDLFRGDSVRIEQQPDRISRLCGVDALVPGDYRFGVWATLDANDPNAVDPNDPNSLSPLSLGYSYEVELDCIECPPEPRTPTPTPPRAACAGDCNEDGQVAVDEIVTAVNIALGNAPLTRCAAADVDGNRAITVDELIAALNRALTGC